MALKYEEDKYYIGAIKFFDQYKDFGFIASNNCGMPDTSHYIQDFYINSFSFKERSPFLEETIVVFQIKKQSNGKRRAINVRRISKSDEDLLLAKTYFGDHENVTLQNNPEYNLFSNSDKYLLRIAASHVLNIIENDEARSPNITLEHFKRFISRYKTNSIGNYNKYVFDSDFGTEDKQIWADFFNSLTSLEILKMLDRYPSVIKYINEQDILSKWISSLEEKELSVDTMWILQINLSYIKDPAKNELRKIIEKKVLRLSDSIVKEYSNKRFETETQLRIKLYPLVVFPVFNLEETIKKSNLNRVLNEFKSRLVEFKSTKQTHSFNYLKRAYENLPEEHKIEQFENIKEAVDDAVKYIINNKDIEQLFSILEQSDFLGVPFIQQEKQQILTLSKKNILNKIDGAINNELIARSLLRTYSQLKKYYNFSSIVEITKEIKEKLLKTDSLFVISMLLDNGLISNESIKQIAIGIIKDWDYNRIKQYLDRDYKHFENEKEIKESIINRTLDLITTYKLSEPFNGNPKEEYESNYDILSENCAFLRSLCNYIGVTTINQRYNSYIESRTSREKILLFRFDVINNLDEEMIQELVNEITLDDAYVECDRWYYPPALKDGFIKNTLKDSNYNLCNIIGNRISQIIITSESIPLIVFLLEIMSINKPDNSNYHEKRNWENNFITSINRIANNNSSNAKLKTILWSLYFHSFLPESALKEIFSDLPPYIQIRVVKKLFQLIAQGRLNKTAESLYTFLGGDEHPLCFPLEITFEYLKVRTKNPSATLDNNIMLRLIDGRDDHSEWIGIRQLLHNCNGRYYIEDDDYLPNDKYYNGVAWVKKENKINYIYIFIPQKMCDTNGEIKEKYNNKYFNQIIQLITFNFSPNSYVSYTKNNAQIFKFTFNDSNHIEILNLARSFNIRYATYRNYIHFECNSEDDQPFCETRLANNLDKYHNLPFYWCASKPCLRPPVRFMADKEWESYTILDFMRILKIPTDYISNGGSLTKFGHYIILNSYMLSFNKFYKHLQCRKCHNLMKPCTDVTNFHTRAVNKFMCADKNCSEYENIVYLNHCFNNKHPNIKCNATIDSRDSKQCPNGQYICPECGACCSTKNFAIRLQHLHQTGGYISPKLEYFVQNDLGHWEKNIFYCYKCGNQMVNGECPNCHFSYKQ